MNNKEQQDSNETVFIDGVTYLIKEDNTASVIRISSSIKDIFIPRSIKYETKEYTITSISKCSLKMGTTINSFQFATDSEVQTIEKNVFHTILIKNLSIPSKLTELKDGWCNQLILDKITVSPDNPRYSMYEDQFLIGKSSIEQENYDVLIFCPRTIEGKIKIPDFIEIIGPHAFENCKKIQEVEFSPDSKLRIIGNSSFSHVSIERISIPTKVTQICDQAFNCCENLKEIDIPTNSELEIIGESAFIKTLIESIYIPSKVTEIKGGCFMKTKIDQIIVSPDNSRYSLYENQFLIGKSSIEQVNFDTLIYSLISVEGKIKIPDFIEIIGAYAFGNNQKIKTVEFSPDSKLRIFEKGSFQESSITRISIPPKVQIIGKNSFSYCRKLMKIFIPENSELQIIEKDSFSSSNITSFSIPSKLTELKDGWCNQLILDKITVSPDNPRYSMYEDQLLIGKSSIEQENYDVLIFCPRTIEGKIKIPDFIEIIGPHAFENCKKIEEVEFSPDSKLRIIEKESFSKSSITNISIPPKVKIIGESSFRNTKQLQNVYFHPNSILEKISNSAFSNSSIVNISLPSSLIEIEEDAFYLTGNLSEIQFSEDSQLQIIGKGAFDSSEIKKINIPKHIKTISENCFMFSKIEQIDFHSDSELIFLEKEAFSKSNIQSIKIPKTVKKIGDECFCFCRNLQNVEIPEDSELQSIESRAFQFSIIKKIFIPKHIKILENEVFDICKNLEQVDFAPDSELEIIKLRAFRLAIIEKISIPRHVRIIEDSAFLCRELKHIEIPENSELEIIKQSAFSFSESESFYIPSKLTVLEDGWCNQLILDKITVSPDNPRYSMYEDQFLIGKSSIEQENYDVLIFCPRTIEGKIKIPDFIEIIGPHAFENCKKIQQVEFSPDSKLRIIGNSSFSHVSIERISIPTKVTQICDQAFNCCENLKEIDIPTNSELEIIGESAFIKTLIESIYIPSKVTELKKEFLSETPNLKSVSISSSNQLYSTCNEGKFIIKKSSIEQQNYDILTFCIAKFQSITIPSFIKVIEDCLFYSNNYIREIHFQHDSKLEIFGESAFESSSIEKISIPSSLKIIGLNCFFKCQKLKKIYIPDDSQLEVFDNSLYGTGIDSLFIPRHVKHIISGRFCLFQNLKIIEIDENCKIEIFDISMLDDKILMISSKLRNQIVFTRIDYEFRD